MRATLFVPSFDRSFTAVVHRLASSGLGREPGPRRVRNAFRLADFARLVAAAAATGAAAAAAAAAVAVAVAVVVAFLIESGRSLKRDGLFVDETNSDATWSPASLFSFAKAPFVCRRSPTRPALLAQLAPISLKPDITLYSPLSTRKSPKNRTNLNKKTQ